MPESRPESLAIVLPVYNEEEIISEVIRDWDKHLSELDIKYTIHAFDDGSKDTSLRILTELQPSIKSLKVHSSENRGHGPTIIGAYNMLSAHTWIFQSDSDGEMSPRYFKDLWCRRATNDFMIGRRSERTQPLSRKIVSFVSRNMIHILYGKGVWDVNSPYRLMRVSNIHYFIKSIPADTFAPNIILSGIVNLYNLPYFELPIPHQNRQTGEVSIKKLKLLFAVLRSFYQTIRYRLTLI